MRDRIDISIYFSSTIGGIAFNFQRAVSLRVAEGRAVSVGVVSNQIPTQSWQVGKLVFSDERCNYGYSESLIYFRLRMWGVGNFISYEPYSEGGTTECT